ncbi:MAG: hypothetical protein HY381_02515 [Candidatus Chisholmbacteria bacterium]|nr:hypothetical protein [Candidatus Chisholmbacteria bacterium]
MIFSVPTAVKILAEVSVNLASGWLGILLISPGIFGAASINQYLRLLTLNLPLAIVSLITAYWLLEKKKSYESK